MISVYKYLESQYAERLISNGELLFRSLAYFRAIEDTETMRTDLMEGGRRMQHGDGLQVCINGVNQFLSGYAFDSQCELEKIFVYCMSTELSAELASRFRTDTCVRISLSDGFLAKVDAALKRMPRVRPKKLLRGEIKYYDEKDRHPTAYADPEIMAMSKLKNFQFQNEYRFAFAIENAFAINRGAYQVTNDAPKRLAADPAALPTRMIKLGAIDQFCKVYRF